VEVTSARQTIEDMASPAQPSPASPASDSAGLAPVAYNGAQKIERSGGVGMMENWKQWQGQVADGKFPLQQYLGGSDHSAVFLTRREAEPRRAAIKLIPAADKKAESQILKWKLAMKLPHANLLRIFEAGQCEIDGTKLLYVVMEPAEENLAEVLTQRSLSGEETRVMLPPLLDALNYLHGKGFVHGQIKPANILAIGDQLKLSSDSISPSSESAATNGATRPVAYGPPGPTSAAVSPAADAWSLGMTLIEVLTAHPLAWDKRQEPAVPKEIEQPFYDIALNTMKLDPNSRWNVDQVKSRLEAKANGRQPAAIATKKGSIPRWQFALAIVAAFIIAYLVWPKGTHPPVSTEVQGTQAASVPKPSPTISATRKPDKKISTDRPKEAVVPAAPAKASTSASPTSATVPARVVQQVSPQVSPSARATISGKVRVSVKVKVDTAGNVASARLESAGPSKYFARVAQQAAQDWKFSPAQQDGRPVPSEWMIHFAFGRSGTDMTSNQITR
jgi:TonB family protein